MKRFVLYLLIVVFTVCSSGCAPLIIGAAAGAGGYMWVKGAMEKDFYVPASKLYSATAKGLKNLGIDIKKNEHDRFSAHLAGEFSDGKDVSIKIHGITERSSKIYIRVGLIGDKMRSEMILSAIEKNL